MCREPKAKDFRLVHGRISQLKDYEDMLIDHAWIELADGTVYDPALNEYFTAEQYRSERCAVVDARYSQIEAMRTADQHGRSGPWLRAA